MEDSIKLGRILGVPVGLHWSVLAIVALLTWALATGWFPERLPQSSEATWLIAGAVTALAFFVSLLAHELAHALVARHNGIVVEGITLWLLGGVARLDTGETTPDVELRVAAVGPLTSLGLAALAGSTWLLLPSEGLEVVREVVLWLGIMNLMLGVFNLAPAFPMDGGRIYRAVLWRRTGNRATATQKAATAGRRFGHLLVGLGVVEIIVLGDLGGLWLALIGWFIAQAATTEESQVRLGSVLHGLTVADVMTRDPITAPNWLTVDRFIDRIVTDARVSTYPLTDFDGRLTGLATLRQLASVPAANRTEKRVRDVGTPLRAVTTVQPTQPATELLEALQRTPGARALVLEHGELVGIVSPSDLARTLEIAVLRTGSSDHGPSALLRTPPSLAPR